MSTDSVLVNVRDALFAHVKTSCCELFERMERITTRHDRPRADVLRERWRHWLVFGKCDPVGPAIRDGRIR